MSPGLIPRPVVTIIATVVIVVWAMSQAASIFVPDYEPPAEIHLAVMLVLGALFGLRKGDQQQGDAEPPAAPAAPAAPAIPPAAAEDEPVPPGRVSASDLIARLKQERDQS